MIRRIIIGIVSLILVVVGLERLASESGEVVVLSTLDAEEQPVETRLWVVDVDGSAYLRSGSPASGWYGRLVATPRIGLDRAGSRASYMAHPEVEMRDAVNQAMREKYGWADQYIGMLFGRDDAIPIRLEIFHE